MTAKVDIGHRPLGKYGGPLFCFLLFITSFYGALFLVGPALSLIYIWECVDLQQVFFYLSPVSPPTHFRSNWRLTVCP